MRTRRVLVLHAIGLTSFPAQDLPGALATRLLGGGRHPFLFINRFERLVEPAFRSKPETKPVEKPKPEEKHRGGGDGGGDDLHPFIQGLLQTLPEPDTVWSEAEREKWLTTAKQIFGLIYREQIEGTLNVTLARKSHR